MACHTPPLKESKEARGNAITQPQSHPFKNVEFRDGWDQGWVMAIDSDRSWEQKQPHFQTQIW